MFKKSVGTMIITMISRILGLLRGTLIAYFFGASGLTDAYYTAFKISNFFRQLLGEGALGNTFIPLYHQKKKEEGNESSEKYIFTILNMVFVFSFIISIFMILFSNYIVNIVVVGFNEEMKILSATLLRIMSFYFLFISMAGMLSAILNTFGYFMIPASTAIFFNLSIIASAIFLTKYFSVSALAYGVLLGGILQFLVVFFPFLKILKKYSFDLNFEDEYTKLLGIRLLPMLVGVFARQINSMTDQFFASFLISGSITALENATRIYLLPVGVFGVTISNIIFPNLSKAVANRNRDAINKNLITALNFLNFLVIPSLIVLTFYSEDVIRLIFSYGKFTKLAVKVTSEALLFYSLGLVFYVGVQLMSKAFYAVGDNKRPARYSICAIIINIVLNIVLIKSMQHKGLALSTSIASAINFLFLLYVYNKRYVKLNLKKLLVMMLKVLISSFIALFISYKIPDLYFDEKMNIIIRLSVFSFVYLLQWVYIFYKKREKVFY